MAWFETKAKPPLEPIYVFDWDAIDKLEKLTPREIVSLICAGSGVSPETACTLRGRPPHKSLMHLFREVKP